MPRDRDMWTAYAGPDARRAPRSKFHAAPVQADGHRFASGREAARYQALKMLQASGAIRELELHPRFPIQVVALHRDGPPWVIEHCGMYTADFTYIDVGTGEIVIEDVKSEPTKTTAYQLRKRLIEAIHGVTITEV